MLSWSFNTWFMLNTCKTNDISISLNCALCLAVTIVQSYTQQLLIQNARKDLTQAKEKPKSKT